MCMFWERELEERMRGRQREGRKMGKERIEWENVFCVSVCLRSIWKLVTNIQTLGLYQKSCQYYLHEQENLLHMCAAVLRVSQLTWWRCFSIPQDMFNSTYYPDTFVRTHYYSGERSNWAISDHLICFVMLDLWH